MEKGGGEWRPGPLDCADKKRSSSERGAEPAVRLSISVCHLSCSTTLDRLHVRNIQAVRVGPTTRGTVHGLPRWSVHWD